MEMDRGVVVRVVTIAVEEGRTGKVDNVGIRWVGADTRKVVVVDDGSRLSDRPRGRWADGRSVMRTIVCAMQ